MNIRYLGHSCFRLEDSAGTSIVTDPYGDVGFSMPKGVRANAVTVSHSHYDHCNVKAVEGNPIVFSQAGNYAVGGISITAWKTFHDDAMGRKRGENLVFKFRIDGMEVCHLGDIGESCTPSLVARLLPIDVLLIPVGGTFTIDAPQAKAYVDALQPAVILPMHYQVEGLTLGIEGVDAFLRQFQNEETIERVGASEIWLTKEAIQSQRKKLIILERY